MIFITFININVNIFCCCHEWYKIDIGKHRKWIAYWWKGTVSGCNCYFVFIFKLYWEMFDVMLSKAGIPSKCFIGSGKKKFKKWKLNPNFAEPLQLLQLRYSFAHICFQVIFQSFFLNRYFRFSLGFSRKSKMSLL